MDTNRKSGAGIDWIALWILFSAWSTLAGWILSWLGCLNRWGYSFAIILLLGGLIFFRREFGFFGTQPVLFRAGPFRSRWLFPKIWLLLTFLVFLGGVLYHPSNYDYLTYRFSRVLYWCWEEHWYWISTVNQRMNYSGTGFEWMMVPLFIFFKTDRLFFLINFVPYLLLPGLIFSVFRELGISKRVSWWWMWVLPSGYCYVLQAGSTGNDSIGAAYLLASLHYALKARVSSPAKHFVFSTLAIALLTGAKASNIPLALPWVLAVFFNRKHLFVSLKPTALLMVLLIAAMVSFLPLGFLNIKFTGDYAGDPSNQGNLKVTHPISGIIGNSLQLAVANLSPPLWPKPISWSGIIPAYLSKRLERDFPRLILTSGEMQIEENAGVGLGLVVCGALVAGAGLVGLVKRTTGQRRQMNSAALWVTAGGAIALLAYLAKMGSEATSRLVAAYYPLMIAGVSVLASLDGSIVKRSLFKVAGTTVMLSALPLLVFSPARPLFPVALTAHYLQKVSPSAMTRFNNVYQVYALRYDALRDIRVFIPKSEKVVGFLPTGDDPETSLWRPFGSRRVVDVTPEISTDELTRLHVHVVVVSGYALKYFYHLKIDDLTQKWSARILVEKNLAIRASQGPEDWYILSCPQNASAP